MYIYTLIKLKNYLNLTLFQKHGCTLLPQILLENTI